MDKYNAFKSLEFPVFGVCYVPRSASIKHVSNTGEELVHLKRRVALSICRSDFKADEVTTSAL